MSSRITLGGDIGKGMLPTGMPISIPEAKSELALPERSEERFSMAILENLYIGGKIKGLRA